MKLFDGRGKVRVTVATSKAKLESITFRRAVDRDRVAIIRLILQERLNPLFLDTKNFVVASEGNEVLGCAQLRAVPFSGTEHVELELSSVVVKEDSRYFSLVLEIT
jgi:N-acetylglutamate synthase-like GNAT family acetyltransferase